MSLTIRNVTKTFSTPEGSTIQALDNVSIDIESNEFLVLLGPSGCGKTTLLRILAGLENADSGGSVITVRLDPQHTRVVAS